MEFTIKRPVKVDIKYLRMAIAVRHGDEEMPADFPFRRGDMWEVVIDFETGKIIDWPAGREEFSFCMKVVDCGRYYLLDADHTVVLALEDDYAPDGLSSGIGGDYVEMTILPDGKIVGWYDDPSIDDFLREDD